jgi:hypothetical protein
MSPVPLMATHISISAWSHRRLWVEKIGQKENYRLQKRKLTVLNNLMEI